MNFGLHDTCSYVVCIFFLFPSTGQSHLFGHVNSDRFYLYTLNNKYRETNGNEHFKFEIIMEELDEKVMSLFVRPQPNGIMNESITASDVTRKSGIDKLIPEMVIDDYFFTPCGYSMNGLFGVILSFFLSKQNMFNLILLILFFSISI